MERVQVEVASGSCRHPGADLYSFTKVDQCPSGYRLNLVYLTEFYTYQGPCLGIVQRFGPSEGRDWSRGVWISEESRGIEFKIFLKTISILTAVSSIKFCQGQWKGRKYCGGREDVERRPH